MKEIYKLEATIVEQKGHCAAGHKVGEKFDLNDVKAPPICKPLLNALEAQSMVLKFGGNMPWLKDKGITRIACPDPENPVIVELKRVEIS